MTVLVLTSTKVLSEALVLLLSRFGFEAHHDVEQEADVALYNLMGIASPYLAPSKVPTLALIENDRDKKHALLNLGYYRCFDTNSSVNDLVNTLRILAKSWENGLGQV